MKMNKVPNFLCYLRMAAAPVIIFLLLYKNYLQHAFPFSYLKGTSFGESLALKLDTGNNSFALICAGVIFVLAMLTDAIDGKIARKYNVVSDKGKQLDPIADKILIIGSLFAFLLMGDWPNIQIMIFPFAVIVLREIIVTVLRTYCAKKGIVVAASIWGKVKTFSQSVAVIACFIAYFCHYAFIGDFFVIAAAAYTLITLFPYLNGFIKILRNKKA